MSHVSKSVFRNHILAADRDFDMCWQCLCRMKAADFSKDPGALVEFQPRLAATIAALSRLYTQIAEERRRLISRKSSFSVRWFAKRQKLLQSHQDALDRTITIGRCLGDSFAWFFYRNDRNLLQSHLTQPAAKHLPTGIGGIGEVEFIRKVRTISGQMVLYHGITSMLRIGDFTLVDLATERVAGLAEIKSWSPEKGQVQIAMTEIGPGLMRPMSNASNKAIRPNPSLSPSARDRLHRQLSRIEETVKKARAREPRSTIRVVAENHASALDLLVRHARRNVFKCVKADNGLVLAAIRSPHRSLFSNVTQT